MAPPNRLTSRAVARSKRQLPINQFPVSLTIPAIVFVNGHVFQPRHRILTNRTVTITHDKLHAHNLEKMQLSQDGTETNSLCGEVP